MILTLCPSIINIHQPLTVIFISPILLEMCHLPTWQVGQPGQQIVFFGGKGGVGRPWDGFLLRPTRSRPDGNRWHKVLKNMEEYAILPPIIRKYGRIWHKVLKIIMVQRKMGVSPIVVTCQSLPFSNSRCPPRIRTIEINHMGVSKN